VYKDVQNVSKMALEITTRKLEQGGQRGKKLETEKFPEFSRLFRGHKRTFPVAIATKSKCNNDLHQGSFHVNSSRKPPHSDHVKKFTTLCSFEAQALGRKNPKY